MKTRLIFAMLLFSIVTACTTPFSDQTPSEKAGTVAGGVGVAALAAILAGGAIILAITNDALE